jgi:hypothetical protein
VKMRYFDDDDIVAIIKIEMERLGGRPEYLLRHSRVKAAAMSQALNFHNPGSRRFTDSVLDTIGMEKHTVYVPSPGATNQALRQFLRTEGSGEAGAVSGDAPEPVLQHLHVGSRAHDPATGGSSCPTRALPSLPGQRAALTPSEARNEARSDADEAAAEVRGALTGYEGISG